MMMPVSHQEKILFISKSESAMVSFDVRRMADKFDLRFDDINCFQHEFLISMRKLILQNVIRIYIIFKNFRTF